MSLFPSFPILNTRFIGDSLSHGFMIAFKNSLTEMMNGLGNGGLGFEGVGWEYNYYPFLIINCL